MKIKVKRCLACNKWLFSPNHECKGKKLKNYCTDCLTYFDDYLVHECSNKIIEVLIPQEK